MADYDSSLPVRTESAGDIDIFVSDATTPAQKLKVNADGSVDTNFAAGSAVEITDGTETLLINPDGSLNATVTATDLDIRDLTSATDSVEVLQATHDNLNLNANLQVGDADVANINPVPISDANGSLTVDATDLDIRDLTAATDTVSIGDGTETALVSVAGELQVKDDGAIALLTTIDGDTSNLDVALSTRATEATLSAINSKLVDGTDIGDVTINNAAGVSAVNIQDGGNSITVDAVDLDIRDLTSASDSVEALQATHDNLNLNANLQVNDTDVSNINPVPVYVEENTGTEIVDFQSSSAVIKDASTNHDYTVSAGATFVGEELWASGSGKMKVEVLVNAVTVFVGFNSTSNPNVRIPLDKVVKANATEVVRITLTNRDNQPQDLYSTLTGVERS